MVAVWSPSDMELMGVTIRTIVADNVATRCDGCRDLIDGGMSRSAWFAQRLADLTGIGVGRAASGEMTAFGAALFAGLGAGIHPDIETAARMRPQTEELRPRLDRGRREAAYARWLDAVARVRS